MTKQELPPGFVTVALAMVLGVGCVPSAPSLASPGTPLAQASAPATAACAPIDLRLPTGERIDLTGTWRGAGSVVFVRQEGNCLWWVAFRNFPGLHESDDNAMITFHGTLATDFTLSGEWAWIVRPFVFGDVARGPVTFKIATSTVDGEETLVLRSTTTSPSWEGGGPYGAATLNYVGPLPPSVANN